MLFRSQNVGKTVEQWGVGESHCDEYATAVLNEAGVLPYDWPDPAKFTVAEGNNQYWDFYKDELQSSPSEGWNAMLMKDGAVLNGEPLSPHMAAIYVNSDGTISLTHYTGDKVNTSYNWTQTQLEKTGRINPSNLTDWQSRFGYKEFKYIHLRR